MPEDRTNQPENLQAEEWRDIAGFAGYQISSLGRVRSRRPKNGRGLWLSTWRFVDGSPNLRGYMRVALPVGGRFWTVATHRLVLETFVGPCPPGLECRHGDGNPGNNQLSNLCWGTPKENAADRRRHGRDMLGEMHFDAKLTVDKIVFLRRLSLFPRSIKYLARLWGVCRSNLERARDGKTWKSVADDGIRLRFSFAAFSQLAASHDKSPSGIATKAGIDRGFISSVRNGRKFPSWVTVCRLADALGTKPENLCEECHVTDMQVRGELWHR